MTRHETPKAGPIDAASLDRLAELAVRVGLNLQPGQDLLLTAPIGRIAAWCGHGRTCL
jgi:aminopeptidase